MDTLLKVKGKGNRAKLEGQLLDWLYLLVRHNIKRGRFWELADVLSQSRADCLGYARVLTFLAKNFGLNTDIVEVVEDNSGRYVPHCVCLVNLADGRQRFLDPWYGSANIHHRLLTVHVAEAGKLKLRQITMKQLKSKPEVHGLLPEHVAGLSFYILGNSYLAQGMGAEAVECYDISLWLYPRNSRAYFNRAIALERMGRIDEAQKDYKRAFASKSHLVRLIATTEDIEPLIELDEKRIGELDQRIYLLHQGFVTGQKESWAKIASRCKITSVQAHSSFNSVAARIGLEYKPQP